VDIKIKEIKFNSAEQLESIQLRNRILREPLGLTFTKEELENEHDQIHIAAIINNDLVGVLLFKKLDNKTLKMRQVAVDSHLQGNGIGKSLIQFAEQWAIDNGYSDIELNARATAFDFYMSLNYKPIGDEFLEVNIPHFKFVKTLF